MPYSSCVTALAKSIAPSCSAPIVEGFTGRGILFEMSQVTYTQLSSNPRILTSITKTTNGKMFAIDNVMPEAFSGTTKKSTAASGRTKFSKVVAFRIPQRGAGTSKDIIEPLCQSPLGYVAVLEKKDKCGDGSFEVFGFQQGLKVDPENVAQDEAANGGDWTVQMNCVEPWAELTFFDTDYATTLAAFEVLLNGCES